MIVLRFEIEIEFGFDPLEMNLRLVCHACQQLAEDNVTSAEASSFYKSLLREQRAYEVFHLAILPCSTCTSPLVACSYRLGVLLSENLAIGPPVWSLAEST